MAQPQQQYPIAERVFSPTQGVASPGGFPLPPPHKRQRTEANATSQPGSPYVQSPYAISPGTPGASSAGASPHFSTVQLPQNAYNTPYTNGNSAPSINLPNQSQPIYSTPHLSPHTFSPQEPQPNYNSSFNSYTMPPAGPGAMGPPSKPSDRSKDDGDVMDVLGGTGINLQEEENYMFQINTRAFNSQFSSSQPGNISAAHSFTQFLPGDEKSFYGAGPANQAGATADSKSQDEFLQKAANQAWYDAAHDLAVSRQKELNDPFLVIRSMHDRMVKAASEHGLELNKDKITGMGTMKLPQDFFDRTVTAKSAVGPDGIMVTTFGKFLPEDSLLVDQLALLSIATKHRLRGLIEDATRISRGRRSMTQGIPPPEWAGVATLVRDSSLISPSGVRAGWESAISPTSIPQKRPHSSTKAVPTPNSEGEKMSNSAVFDRKNELARAFRNAAQTERNFEEERLRKRRAREAKASADSSSRQGSLVPGTPGSIAPEVVEKALTKKEQKKKADARNVAVTQKAANATTNQFLGGRRKQYAWMNNASASGTSTPARIVTQNLSGTPGSAPARGEPAMLTSAGVRRLGDWREDYAKGQGIQMRDWIAVLERDRMDKRSLQKAYMWLDQAEPK